MRYQELKARDAGRLALIAALIAFSMAGSARAECSLAKLLELPVTMVAGRPTATIKINGQDAKLFVNNSVYFNLVHADSAKRLQMLPVGKYGQIQIVDPSHPNAAADVARAKTISAPGLDLQNIDFLTDSSGSDPQVDGSLGQNLLGIGDTEFDVHDGVIRLFRSTGCGTAPLAYWDEAKNGFSSMPIDNKNEDHFILIKATINGQLVTALLASGASYSFLTEDGAKRLHLMPGDRAAHRINSRIWTSVASIKLGDEEVRNTQMPIQPYDTHDLSERFDMLLGVDFLLSHHVYIAKDQGRMYFTYSGGRVFAPKPTEP